MKQSLQLKQSQSLVMTQQLQQSIKLLQLSSLELSEFVDQEIEKNPLLQHNDGSNETPENAQASSSENEPATEAKDAPEPNDYEQGEAMDANYGDGWQHEAEGGFDPARTYTPSQERTAIRSNDEDSNLEHYTSAEKSLQEHLREQLVDITDPVQRLIGSQLIDLIDEGGYLRESVDELTETLGAEPEQMQATITALQRFDPTGVFARDLKECLSLQLKEKNLFDPMMQSMMEHLHLIERGDIDGLQKACGADDEDFADMLAQIRALDPFPARQFNADVVQPVIPDAFIRKSKEGGWQVELNHEVLPRVLLDREYYVELDACSRKKEDKKYLSEQLSQANWLVKAIDQRAQTILKVSAEIAKQQDKFMRYGIQFLKPLTLKDIALAVDMHESTISRVTTNKYIATPRGIFEMKFFFTSSIHAASGSSDVSSKTVMYYIRELIDKEEPKKILSDDAIVTLLKDHNIDIARRTVAKYREAMHIPSSVVRRRQKKRAQLA